ncbi:hypothetical protein ABEP17_12940 [Priestia flexa]|uniref:hypothetical protein n=1 Tax=Priestia flexa TaxID=86664 RepID=UPI0013D2A467|nr:hypothetical protein [Priestia flexa]MCA1202036.1 hypothetical protein [Priestia flexa]
MSKFFKVLTSSLVVGVLLAGCGSNSDSSNGAEETKEEPKAAEQKPLKNDVPKPEKDESGNYILNVPGQKVKDDGATAELLKIKEVNETVDISPLKVTIEDIKVIKLTDLDEEFAEGLEWMSDTKINPEETSYVQVNYTAENTSDSNIEWYDIMNVVTDKGEQIDGQLKDFISDDGDSDSQFIGKVKKEYTDGFVVKNEDINSVKLVFGYTEDEDYNEITPEQTVEYTFE